MNRCRTEIPSEKDEAMDISSKILWKVKTDLLCNAQNGYPTVKIHCDDRFVNK